jgi:hypothetical protein
MVLTVSCDEHRSKKGEAMTTTTHRPTNAKPWRIAGLVAATATLALVGATGASAHATATENTTKTEQFTLMADSTTQAQPTFSVIATGAFTAGGTATVDHGTITVQLPKGTITLQASTDHVATHTTPDCFQEKTTSGHYTIASGTDAYLGVTGHGTTRTTVRAVESKNGTTCSENPDAVQFVGTATGIITLP